MSTAAKRIRSRAGRRARSRVAAALAAAMLVATVGPPALARAELGKPLHFVEEATNPVYGTDGPADVIEADGTLWFSVGNPAGIGTDNVFFDVAEFTAGFNAGAKPGALAAGPDGNVWFTDDGTTPAIGKISPTGAVTEFDLPAGSDPASIADGPDGNLWFTNEGSTKAIGRITPSGTITQFTSGLNPGADPKAIVAGAGGDMWFTDIGTTPAIGKITTSGVISEFSEGLNAGALLDGGIANAPDDDLWFNDNGTTKAIGRITIPTGNIVEFPDGPCTACLSPSIAAGADGNIWISQDGSGATPGSIDRISPTGEFTMFTNSAFADNGDGLGPLATGPDGNLWFADDAIPGDGRQAIGFFGMDVHSASIQAPAVVGSGQEGTQQVCEGEQWSDWAGQQPVLDAFPFDGIQWELDGVPLPGETAENYTPTSAQVGDQLSCRVTVTYQLFPTTVFAVSSPVTVLAQTTGPVGSAGTTGPAGATGPAGPAGKAGSVELVTCKTSSVKTKGRTHAIQSCTTKLVSGVVKLTSTLSAGVVTASLSRGRSVYASGEGQRIRGATKLLLRALRAISRGTYTLELGAHTHETIIVR